MRDDMTQVKTLELQLTRDQIREALTHCRLDPEEEVVIRMRYGIGLAANDRITYRGEGNPELQAKLALIEKTILDHLEDGLLETSDPATMDELQNL